jgi:ABC-type amino acid transport substrate-binding protein
VKEFQTMELIRKAGSVRVACVEGGLLVSAGRDDVPGLEVTLVPSEEQFLKDETGKQDALLTTAETGSVLTMIRPEFSVIIPEGVHVQVPVVFATRDSGDLHRLVNTWVNLMRYGGKVDELYEHWILGKAAAKKTTRWSVVRTVIDWVK